MLSIRKLWKGPKPLHVDNHSNKMWLIQGGAHFSLLAAEMPRCSVHALFWSLASISDEPSREKSVSLLRLHGTSSSKWVRFWIYRTRQVLATCHHVGRLKLQSQFHCSARAKSDRVRFFLVISNQRKSQQAMFFCAINSRFIIVLLCFSQSISCNTEAKLYRQSIKFSSALLWFNGHEELFLAIVCLSSQG